MIVVVDYGMGNIGSVLNMLKKIGANAVISSEPEIIRNADRLILPGVGAFDTGMRNLQTMGLLDILTEKVVQEGTPVLGICLGMQLLTQWSEEGALPGLGWVEGQTVRFHFNGATEINGKRLFIPHMGWNTISANPQSALFQGLNGDSRFYFVHSYHVVCDHPEDVAAQTHYGYDFVSAIQRNHIQGTQFHPEKSHLFGMRILRNFAEN